MADGIASYVEDKGYLSEKQAQWVCQNADYWKMKRPSELAAIVVGPKEKQQDTAGDDISSKDGAGQLMRLLKRMERKLDQLLSAE